MRYTLRRCPRVTSPRRSSDATTDPTWISRSYSRRDWVVYDVTRGRDFYGRGGAYAKFAGAECSRALAKMSLDPNDVSKADISDLTPEELNVLDDWMRKFDGKYPVVGKLL